MGKITFSSQCGKRTYTTRDMDLPYLDAWDDPMHYLMHRDDRRTKALLYRVRRKLCAESCTCRITAKVD